MKKIERSSLMGQRIKKLMREQNLTEAALAREIGTPQATVSRILSGATQDPRISTLAAIARVLGSSVGYLTESLLFHHIPVLEWAEILPFTKGNFDEDSHRAWLVTGSPPVSGTFAVRTTPSMEPRYRSGSVLIVEPTEVYRDFQVAIVSFDYCEPTVRRLTRDGALIYLKKLDASSDPPVLLSEQPARIIGVVVESRMTEQP